MRHRFSRLKALAGRAKAACLPTRTPFAYTPVPTRKVDRRFDHQPDDTVLLGVVLAAVVATAIAAALRGEWF